MNARKAEWGHWGITLYDGDALVGGVQFPCGPQGPVDGMIGSPERQRYTDAVKAWLERGDVVALMQQIKAVP